MDRRRFVKAVIVLGSAGAAPARRGEAQPPSAAGGQGTVMEDTIYAFAFSAVVKATDQFPRRGEASMVELRDGKILLAYANHQGPGDNDRAHIAGTCLLPDGQPVGEEWTIVAAPEGGLNAMSPALRRLPDGRLGMLFSYRISVKEASRRFIFSTDEGRTWSEPVVVGQGGYVTGCHDRFTILSTGRFLAPLHCTDDWNKHYLHVRVSHSDDAGQTWVMSDKIELPPLGRPPEWKGGWNECGCVEPCVAERADGSLLMCMRTAMGTQFCSESFDGGETWTSPRSMEVISPQAPANLTRIPGSADLLLVWTPNYDVRANGGGERHTIMACVSSDGGRSWPHVRRKVLVHDPIRRVDYPSVLYREGEVWITLRCREAGKVSTGLMRVPLKWLYEGWAA